MTIIIIMTIIMPIPEYLHSGFCRSQGRWNVVIQGRLKQSAILFGQFQTQVNIPCLTEFLLHGMSLVANRQICCFPWMVLIGHPHEFARPTMTKNQLLLLTVSRSDGWSICDADPTGSVLHVSTHCSSDMWCL